MKKDLSVAGVGVASLFTIKKGLDVAADYESALLDIRSAYQEAAAAGALSAQEQEAQLRGLGNLAVDLGNKLQGNTQNYVGILTALKQAGLPGDQVIGGAGRSAAYLANVSGALARGQEREQAKELGQFGLMFKLRPEDFETQVNLFSALKDKFDIESSSLIESAKYFQATSNQLGITGTRGAEDTVKFFALLKRQAGMEGSMAGTGARAFFMQLATEEKKIAALKEATGIELKPFDEKGMFRGYDAMFKEMEKFRALNQQQSAKWLNVIFGERGQEVASAMVKVGTEGWKNVTAETAKAVPVNQKIEQQMATYNAKMEALTGSIQNLTATAFMPLLDTVKPIVDVANQGAGALQGWSSANPGLTQTAGTLASLGAVTLTVVGGFGAATKAWRLFRIASSIGVNEAGQLTFLRTLRTETAATSAVMTSSAGKAGLYSRTVGRVPSVVTTTVALVGVEYAISKTLELIDTLEKYDEARKGERSASVAATKSLQVLETDYAKRGERLPAHVHANAASAAMFSLNREEQLRESLAAGPADLFKSFGKFFTMQPMNPYGAGPLQRFDPRSASFAFRERAPELGNPEVMRAFIEQLRNFKLPADEQGRPALAEAQRQDVAKALQMAFPESYQKAQAAVAQRMEELQQGMQDVQGPLQRTADASGRAASNLDRFSVRLSGFQFPTAPIAPFGTQLSSPQLPFGQPTFKFPSKASGGKVTKGGFVEVHDRETIVPAQVTERFRGDEFPRAQFTETAARAILREHTTTSVRFREEETRASGRSARPSKTITINGGIHIHVPHGSPAADDPRELARLLEHELEMQSERA